MTNFNIPWEVADAITLENLKVYRDSIRESIEDCSNKNGWHHKDDIADYGVTLFALNLLIDHFTVGGET